MYKFDSKLIGSAFALSLLIPPNMGFDIFGINFDDLPLLVIFLVLITKKLINFKLEKQDRIFFIFVLSFFIYVNIFVEEINYLNKTNLRFIFYFLLCYLCVDILFKNNQSIIDFFDPLGIVMLANFVLILFQIQIPGNINGWILNNTASSNPLNSGRLGGLQGGGPNVIGIICAVYLFVCLFKIFNSDNPNKYLIENKVNTFLLTISLINLFLTYSRGSYIAFLFGLVWLLLFSQLLNKKIKIFVIVFLTFLSGFLVFAFPSVFLKQSNRTFLNSLGIENVEIFTGSGGGNYIKKVYKEYLITLDENELIERFGIKYNEVQNQENNEVPTNQTNDIIQGFLKLEFDYRDSLLPRSVIRFYYSDEGENWNQIGSKHTSGSPINLLENDSFFEVGGWSDGQSPGGEFLSGYVKNVVIETTDYYRKFELSEIKRDTDYLILTPEFKNNYESDVIYKADSIRLDRPRDYWIAIPNETNLSMKDFQITLQVEFESIPKGHETLFSQSSILRINEEFNDQSWKWSIIDGRMYFFWIEDVTFGYSQFIGGQSLRSGKLISNNGDFDSIVSDFTLSQYDEITTSHNGFLTMAVEYGLFVVLIIVLSIFYLIYDNFDSKNFFEIGLLLMFLLQNLSNDLIYAPDTSIYIWLLIIYFFNLSLRVDN
ncbi:O-antigen ligase family protein [Acidimicrobiaceae bacterium]|nr:O-antigen ligase family protein [Acidimicrobiaceae bacterium]